MNTIITILKGFYDENELQPKSKKINTSFTVKPRVYVETSSDVIFQFRCLQLSSIARWHFRHSLSFPSPSAQGYI